MIVELLDISEISNGTFAVRRDELDLDELVWSVIRGLRPRWERAGWKCTSSTLARENHHLGDNRRLRWALGHLLDNSINYTLKDGRITFWLWRGDAAGPRPDPDRGYRRRDQQGRPAPNFQPLLPGPGRTPPPARRSTRAGWARVFIARAVAEAHRVYLSVDSKVGVGRSSPWPCRSPAALLLELEPPVDADATAPSRSLELAPGQPDEPEDRN
jgi:signal transduction histidine kinase